MAEEIIGTDFSDSPRAKKTVKTDFSDSPRAKKNKSADSPQESPPKSSASSTTGGESGAFVRPITPSTPTSASAGSESASWTETANTLDSKFQNFKKTLPSNLKNTDESNYNLRGYWEGLGKPDKFDYSQKKEADGTYHGSSRNPKTGEILKKRNHPTFNQALEEDAKMGYMPYISPDGTVYTFSKEDKIPSGFKPYKPTAKPVDAVQTANPLNESKPITASQTKGAERTFPISSDTYKRMQAKGENVFEKDGKFYQTKSNIPTALKFGDVKEQSTEPPVLDIKGKYTVENLKNDQIADYDKSIKEYHVPKIAEAQAKKKEIEAAVQAAGGLDKIQGESRKQILSEWKAADETEKISTADIANFQALIDKHNKKPAETSWQEYVTGGLASLQAATAHAILPTISLGSKIIVNAFGGTVPEDNVIDNSIKYHDAVAASYPLPKTMFGNVVGTVMPAIPLIYTLGLVKNPSGSYISHFKNLATVMGTQEGAEKFNEAYKQSTGNMVESYKGFAEGFVQGVGNAAKLELEMGVGKSILSPMISKPIFNAMAKIKPKIVNTETVKNLADRTGDALGVGLVFSGTSALETALEKGQIDSEEALTQFFTGIAFEAPALFGAAKKVSENIADGKKADAKSEDILNEKSLESGLNLFFQSENADIEKAANTNISVEDLKQKALETGLKVQEPNELNKKISLLYAQIGLQNLANLKRIAELAKNNPMILNKYIDKTVSNIEEANAMKQKVLDVFKMLDPKEREITKLSNEIAEIDNAIKEATKSLISQDAATRVRAELAVKELSKLKESKTEELRNLIMATPEAKAEGTEPVKTDKSYSESKQEIEDKLNQQLEDNKDRLDDIDEKGGTKTVRQKIYQEYTNDMVELEKVNMQAELKKAKPEATAGETIKTKTNEKNDEDGEQKRGKDGEENVPKILQSEGEDGGQQVDLKEKQVLAPEGAVTATPIENPKVVIQGTRQGLETFESSNYDSKADGRVTDARGLKFDENGVSVQKDNKGNQVVHIAVDAVDVFGRAGKLQVSVIVPEGTNVNTKSIKEIVDAEVAKIKAKGNEDLKLGKVQQSDFAALKDAVVNELKNPSAAKSKAEAVPNVEAVSVGVGGEVENVINDKNISNQNKTIKITEIVSSSIDNLSNEEKLKLAEISGDKANAIKKNKIAAEYAKDKVEGKETELVKAVENAIKEQSKAGSVEGEVEAKLQKSIEKINEQRDSELKTATGKVIYTDNPTDAEKAQRVKDRIKEINDRYDSIIEREKEKQSLKEAPKTEAKPTEQSQPKSNPKIDEIFEQFETVDNKSNSPSSRRDANRKMKELISSDPKIKLIFDNIKDINRQLEEQKLITKKGNCP